MRDRLSENQNKQFDHLYTIEYQYLCTIAFQKLNELHIIFRKNFMVDRCAHKYGYGSYKCIFIQGKLIFSYIDNNDIQLIFVNLTSYDLTF